MKYLFAFIGLVLVGSLFFVIKFTLSPRPLRVMNPTVFSSYEEIGSSFYGRMIEAVRENNLIVIGYSGLFPESLWKPFLKKLENDRGKFEVFYHQSLDAPIEGAFRIDAISGEEWIEKWLLDSNKSLQVLFLPYDETDFSQRIDLFNKIKKSQKKIMTLSEGFYSLNPSEQKSLEVICEQNKKRESRIFCLPKEISGMHFRRKIDGRPLSAMLLQVSQVDYFLLIHPPSY